MVISVKLTKAQFEGQTKTKLGSSEMRTLVNAIVSEKLEIYLEENPAVGRAILDKALMALGLTQRPLKLLYTYPAVVVGMVYALVPFMILAVYSSAEKMDWSLVEAARDLGASAPRAFFTITFKLTLPGLLSGVILTFIPSMGLFFIADILGGNKVVLVGSLIQDQLNQAHNWPFAAALSVVLMLLTSLLIWFYRRVTHVKELEGIL